MQYQVPQFIETEDRIIGGVLTLKQFLIISGGAGLSFLFYFIFTLAAWIFITIFIGSAVLFIAFIKVNGRPVPVIARAAFNYYWNPRFYLWKAKKAELPKMPAIKTPAIQKHEEHFEFHFKKAPQTPPAFETSEVEEAEVRAIPPAPSIPPKSVAEPKLAPKPATPARPEGETKPYSFRGETKREETEAREAEPQKFKRFAPPAPRESEPTPEASRPTQKLPRFFHKKEAELPPESKPEPETMPESAPAPKLPSFLRRREAPAPAGEPVAESVPEAAPRRAEPETLSAGKTIAQAGRGYYEEPRIKFERDEAEVAAEAERSPRPSVMSRRDLLSRAGNVQNLMDKINTTKTSLPKREKSGGLFARLRGEKYELLRRATGEIEKAKRIDYK